MNNAVKSVLPDAVAPGPLQPSRAGWPDHVLAIAMGLTVFMLIVGPRVLLPDNIGWLGQGDAATHYLGWVFYRAAPWSFPPGLNPDYGLELANSIVFSDSNAMLAMLLKPFAGLLPQPFQYFGLWLLVCYVLQAWFAFALMGLVTESRPIRLMGAALLACAPPMLVRTHAHFNLTGHFLLLAALWMALRPSIARRTTGWAILLPAAALVHAYLLAMAGAIWFTDLVGRAISRRVPVARAATEAVGILGLTATICWLAGYFSALDGVVGVGFGLYRMNLLSLVDSNGWSFLLPDIPGGPGEYEGFNYLGAGMLLLAICALPALAMKKTGVWSAVRRRAALFFVCIGLTLFALSSTWGIGSHSFVWPIPDALMRMANVFHASGRMFWPVYYLLCVSILFMVARGYSTRVATVMVCLGLTIQVVDSHKLWQSIRAGLMTPPSATWRTAMVNPFWAQAGTHYTKVRWLLPTNVGPQWREVAQLAARYGLGTDAIFLARISARALTEAQQQAMMAIASGRYEPDSLYVLDPSLLPQVEITLDPNRDLLAQVDGFQVIAPGWHQCKTCTAGAAAPSTPAPAAAPLGQHIGFGKDQPGLIYLAGGWSAPEPAGTWSLGTRASIVVPVSTATPPSALVFETLPLINARHPKQTVQLQINGVDAGAVVLTEASGGRFEVNVPASARAAIRQNGRLQLALQFPDAVRPVDIGLNTDSRLLAIALVSMTWR